MWLRRLLVALYGLEERSAFTPDELDWDALPERCALQFHWHRTPEFLGPPRPLRLLRGRPRAASARRPRLDPPLRPARAGHGPLARRRGRRARPSSAAPTRPRAAFVEYARSPRAQALLSVTPEWWEHADARVAYESLVADPADELGRIASRARRADGSSRRPRRSRASGSSGCSRRRRTSTSGRGASGCGRSSCRRPVALEIAEAYPGMRRFGYTVGVDEATALARWRAAAVAVEPPLAQAS